MAGLFSTEHDNKEHMVSSNLLSHSFYISSLTRQAGILRVVLGRFRLEIGDQLVGVGQLLGSEQCPVTVTAETDGAKVVALVGT